MTDPSTPHGSGFREVVEHIPAIVFMLTNEERPALLYVSRQVDRMTGHSADEWMRDPSLWTRSVHPDDRERIRDQWRLALRLGSTFQAEYRIVRSDGRTLWVREITDPVLSDDHSIAYWQGVTIDITDRHSTEEALARSEAKYRALVERLPAVVYVDADEERPRNLYISPNAEQVLGYRPSEYLEDPELLRRTMHEDDRAEVDRRWLEALARRAPFDAQYRVRRPGGGEIWVRDSSIPVVDEDGSTMFWQGVMLDITAQRVAEAELLRSESRYRVLVEQVPARVYVCTDEPEPRTLFASPSEGSPPAQPPGVPWRETVHPDDRDRVVPAWDEAVRTGETFDEEYRHHHHEHDEMMWIRDICSPVRDEHGRSMFRQGVMLDITRAKEAEAELRRSERRYRAFVEQVPAVLYEMGPDDERRTLYVSQHVEQILGYSRVEWLDQPDIWTELLHPDDREVELAAHDLQTQTGEPWSREYRLIADDGRVVWVRDQAVLVRDPDGDRWQGVMLDITAQKDAEEALRSANDELELRVLARTTELEEANEMMSLEIGERRRVEVELREAEERYRLLVEDLPAAVYVWEMSWEDDPDAHYRPQPYMSPQIERILGYTATEFGRTGFWRERLHPHDRDRIEASLARSKRTGEPFGGEYRFLAKDGRVVWVLDRATLLRRDQQGEPRTFQGMILDVTAQKEAEAKAAEAEARYRQFTEQGPVVTYAYSVDHGTEPPGLRVEYVSPQAAELVGYPQESWFDDPERWFEMMHPDDRERIGEATARNFVDGGPWALEYRMIAGDGRVVWLHDQGHMVERDARGRPSRFHGAIVDVTQEREERGRLADSERRYRELVEGAPVVAWTETYDRTNHRSRYTYIAPQAEDVFGYSVEELMSEPDHFRRLVHPDDLERVMAGSVDADESLDPWEDEYRVIARDGTIRWIRSTARAVPPAPDDDIVVWHGVAMDVTARHLHAAAEGGRLDAPERPPAG
jgi:PAS domain S-box-containing protein